MLKIWKLNFACFKQAFDKNVDKNFQQKCMFNVKNFLKE